jgi:N-acetylglutamate synthase-like GNAT family acetyltransferase
MSEAQETKKSRLSLRTYRASDLEYVHYLFYSSYFSLVPEGVRSKLKSPLFWILWIAFYSYLLGIVPVLLSGLDWPSWCSLALRIFFTVSWILVSFAGMFVYTDRFEVIDKVEDARQNDLSDPETYYLNWIKEEVEVNDQDERKKVSFDKDAKPATELVRTKKPKEEQAPSHFWVLLLDNKPVGTIGLAHYLNPIVSKRTALPAAWKRIAVALLQRYYIKVPESLQNLEDKVPKTNFAEAHKPKEATLQRLTVKSELQNCGLSTLLIDRAMAWAHEKEIDRVYATTNELQSKVAGILKTHHGFKLVNKKRTGWFGQKDCLWECQVKKWVEDHPEAVKTYTTESEKDKNTVNTI